MRNTKLAMLVLLAAGGAAIAGPTPAAAIDYPYCIQGGGWGVPGDCAYRSYAECQASLSGRYAIATSIRASPLPGRNIGKPIGITTVSIN